MTKTATNTKTKTLKTMPTGGTLLHLLMSAQEILPPLWLRVLRLHLHTNDDDDGHVGDDDIDDDDDDDTCLDIYICNTLTEILQYVGIFVSTLRTLLSGTKKSQ